MSTTHIVKCSHVSALDKYVVPLTLLFLAPVGLRVQFEAFLYVEVDMKNLFDENKSLSQF